MNKYVLAAFLINLASTPLYALRGNNGNPQNQNNNQNNNMVGNNQNPPVQHMHQPYIVNVQPAPRPGQPHRVFVTLSTGHIIHMPDGLGNDRRNNQNPNQRP